MFAQLDAVARLLRDDDPETVRMVKEQLALGGEDFLGGLRKQKIGRGLTGVALTRFRGGQRQQSGQVRSRYFRFDCRGGFGRRVRRC